MNSAPGASSLPPTIPGYAHQRELGRGGFSHVYLYEQQMPRRPVAIKVLRIDTMDARQRQAFTDEADTMAMLGDHPNIVSVLSADLTADGRPYLVMAYHPGDDLAKRVARRPLGLPEALRTGVQLASAVETAHRVGVLHRDIKPANVLVSRSGAPGLTDFGIARAIEKAAEDEEIGVSIPWSAPEVLSGASNGSAASEVYSLGATIWHLVVGHSPFHVPGGDNSQSAVLARILHSPVPTTGVPGVPPSLERLLAQTMAKNPEHRPRSALSLARDLQRIEQEQAFSRTELVLLDFESPSHPVLSIPPIPTPDAAPVTQHKAPMLLDTFGNPSPAASQLAGPGGTAPTLHRPVAVEPATTAPAVPPRRPAWLAPAIGAVVAVGVVTGAFALLGPGGAGGAEDPESVPTTGRQTQQPPAALTEAPETPVVTGRRQGASAVFTWPEAAGTVMYRWRRQEDSLEAERTVQGERLSVRFGSANHVCVVVTAVGPSMDSQPSETTCVGAS